MEPIDGLVGREVDTPDELGDEFRVETSEDIVLNSAGGSEFQMPDASQELFASGARGKRGPFEEDTPVTPRPASAAPVTEATPAPIETAHAAASAPEAPSAPPSRIVPDFEPAATTSAELAGSGAMAAPCGRRRPVSPGGDQVSSAEPADRR